MIYTAIQKFIAKSNFFRVNMYVFGLKVKLVEKEFIFEDLPVIIYMYIFIFLLS